MINKITLSQEQREAIKQELDSKIEMLSDDEIEILASLLNDKINIPFIREGTEQSIFVKIVRETDRLLYQNLPSELYCLVHNASDGISEEEAAELKTVLISRLSDKFDIKYVPEMLEKEIFEQLIDLIVDSMKRDANIAKLI